MLTTVEEIEAKIASLLAEHDDELVAMHERMEFIVQQGVKMLDDYQMELDEHYAGQEEKVYKEEYLALYRQAKQNILEGSQQLLQKEAEGTLAKIPSTDPGV